MTRIRAFLSLMTLLAVGACTTSKPPAPPAISTPAPPPPPTATPTATATQPSATAPAAKLIEITVTGRSVSPPPGRVDVKQGEQVRLVVRSDTPDEVHVHGYDIERPVGPGQDAVIEFAATQTGLFEVETHDSRLLLTQLAVR